MRRVPVSIVAALALLLLAPVPQDKPGKKPPDPPAATAGAGALPAPPQDQAAKPLPPVLVPALSPVERRDLLQQFRRRHAIEGTYRLRHMVVAGGKTIRGARGYLVLGQRHLSMQLYAPSTADHAHIQAVFREYRVVTDRIVMSTLIGHRNKDNGDIALEPIGFASEHRFVLIGAVLRLIRSKDEYLDFERIE